MSSLSSRSNPDPIPDLMEHDDLVLAEVASEAYTSGEWSFEDLSSMHTIMPLVRSILLSKQLAVLQSARTGRLTDPPRAL